MDAKDDRLTYDVAEAGRKAGLGRNAAYEAARRGDMPTIRIGHRLLVPKLLWDRKLNGETLSQGVSSPMAFVKGSGRA